MRFFFRYAAISLAMLLLAYIGLYVKNGLERRQDDQKLEFDSVQLQTTLPLGATRQEIQRIFDRKHLELRQRGDETLVLLKRRSSPFWYCSYEDVGVHLTYGPYGASAEEPRLLLKSNARWAVD